MHPDAWILVLADDLTGALEIGAKFADCGLSARVATSRDGAVRGDCKVLVIDTETRHLSPESARASVREAAAGLDPWLIYKKTDSTLRGHIAAEFRGLLEAFPSRRITYAPAYPDLGRTVQSGELLVDGIPVHRTAFANDPLNPIAASHIPAMLGDVPATVMDGATNEHVHETARVILSSKAPGIAAGPGALAGALAQALGREIPHPLPEVRRVLVINGSLHPASRQQIEQAPAREGWTYFTYRGSATGLDRAHATGEEVHRALTASTADTIVVFGGDTAYGIHRALGGQDYESIGEVLPGVPMSRSAGVLWITKAGGFGGPDLLCEIQRQLT